MTLPLTPRQAELLAYVESRATSPSLEEIRAALGLRSKTAAHRLVVHLERRGFLRRQPRRARSLVAVRPAAEPWRDLVAAWDGSSEQACEILSRLQSLIRGEAR